MRVPNALPKRYYTLVECSQLMTNALDSINHQLAVQLYEEADQYRALGTPEGLAAAHAIESIVDRLPRLAVSNILPN